MQIPVMMLPEIHLPAEPYFMDKSSKYYNDKINPGFAAVVGEYVFSSSYDKGEVWSSKAYCPRHTY